MRRNKLFILGLFFAFVAVLSLTLVSGTWAKYTSTTSASATARVAKWAWTINSTNVEKAANFSMPLFETIYENDVTDTWTAEDPADVKKSESSPAIIAPGTKGKVELVIANASEVKGKVEIVFEITKDVATLPLEFAVKEDTALNIDTTTPGQIKVTIDPVLMGASHTVELSWKWAFEGAGVNDTVDTNLGTAESLANVTVNATVVFTQIN